MNLYKRIYGDKDFMSISNNLLNHKEFIKTKEIFHHGSTRFDHSVKVGYFSYKLSKIFGFDYKSAAKAGVLHDFFLIRDDKNLLTETKMFIKHPKIAKENAIKYFQINEKEQNIIESHMFPVSNVVPKSKEAWIVTLCDKIVALQEGASRVKASATMFILFLVNFIK